MTTPFETYITKVEADLTSEDISHYQRVVVALEETMRVMKEINKVIVHWLME